MVFMGRPNIRIASYNIRKARGLDQRKDPGRVLDVINDLDADVVVLQEADHRFGYRKSALPHGMIETHSDYTVAPLAANDHSLGWHGNALLLKSEIDVSSVRTMRLPGLEPRGAAIVSLQGKIDLTVVATHLGLRRRDRRVQQHAICEALADDTPTVVAGDFNEWSSKDGLEPFSKQLSLHAPGRSFPARYPLAPLDRFAVCRRLGVLDTGVLDRSKARRASDHLPVWCLVADADA